MSFSKFSFIVLLRQLTYLLPELIYSDKRYEFVYSFSQNLFVLVFFIMLFFGFRKPSKWETALITLAVIFELFRTVYLFNIIVSNDAMMLIIAGCLIFFSITINLTEWKPQHGQQQEF